MKNNNLLIEDFIEKLFKSIKCVIIDEEPCYITAEVLTCLGYDDISLVKEKYLNGGDDFIIRKDIVGIPDKSIINEAGLYILIMNSDLPEAKIFQNWVTSEVLPTMEKIGFINAIQIMKKISINETLHKLRQENIELQNEINKLKNKTD